MCHKTTIILQSCNDVVITNGKKRRKEFDKIMALHISNDIRDVYKNVGKRLQLIYGYLDKKYANLKL